MFHICNDAGTKQLSMIVKTVNILSQHSVSRIKCIKKFYIAHKILQNTH